MRKLPRRNGGNYRGARDVLRSHDYCRFGDPGLGRGFNTRVWDVKNARSSFWVSGSTYKILFGGKKLDGSWRI